MNTSKFTPNVSLKETPIFVLLGERGDGKTLTAYWMGLNYNSCGMKVIANFHITGFKAEYMTSKQFRSVMNTLTDCVVIFDEGQVVNGKLSFFKKSSQELANFITQLRKRRIIMIITTQKYLSLAKDMRDMANYIIGCSRVDRDVPGVVNVQIHDMRLPQDDDFVKSFILDGRKIWDGYDTNELISDDSESDPVADPEPIPEKKEKKKPGRKPKPPWKPGDPIPPKRSHHKKKPPTDPAVSS